MSSRILRFATTMVLAIAGIAPAAPVLAQAQPVTPQRAQPSPTPSTSALPLADTEIVVQRGGHTHKVRPLQTVKLVNGREAVADRVIVTFKDGLSDADKALVHTAAAQRGAAGARALQGVGRASQEIDVSGAASVEQVILAYERDPRVVAAEPDNVRGFFETPNDPLFSTQWDMTKIQAPAAWNLTHGSSARRIAILDSGIYEVGSTTFGPGHPDINGKVYERVNFGTSPDLDDWVGHGTHVAGTAAAQTNNSIGVAGVGYSTLLQNVKVGNDDGSIADSSIINGIYWAADHGANVINMSLGGPGACPAAMQAAVNYAWSRNVVVVAAAGNAGTSTPNAPADCANVVSVAATDSADARASFSSWGSWVTVAAPGVSINSTSNVGGYVILSGTSMASPHVAGLGALIWATSWGTDAASVVARIRNTADNIGGAGTLWQTGRINAASAVAPPPTCSSVSVTTNPPSPQNAGVLVNFMATASCGGAAPEYRWMIAPPGGSWSLIRDWSPISTWSWNTAGLPGGLYQVDVSVRAGGATAAQAETVVNYQLTTPRCSAVSVSANPASPQTAGTAVTFTANGTCSSTGEYKFWMLPPGGPWTVVRDWSMNNTFNWTTSGLAGGTYQIEVWARTTGSTDTYQAYVDTVFQLNSGPPTLSASPTSTGPGGTVLVNFSGSTSANDWVGLFRTSDGARLDMKFRSACTGTASGTCSFNMPAAAGTYEFRLYSNGTWVLMATSNTVTVVVPAATLSASPTTVGPGGTETVAFAGSSSATDWVGLFRVSDGARLDMKFRSACSGTSSGTCSFTMPVAAGDYVFRLYANGTWTVLATSNTVAVQASTASLTASPTTNSRGGTETVSFTGSGSASDWIGLFRVSDGSRLDMKFLSACTGSSSVVASGSCMFTMPASAGTYEFRLYANGTWNLLATSNTVTVP